MKAGAFRYIRPASLVAALELLAREPEAAALAGGQSLLAMLNLRVTAPSLLVDLGAIDELRGIALQGDTLRIGALSRHRELMDSPLVRAHAPLLAAALEHVAHPAVRNRGTLGGSLALADPAAEMPACVTALGGSVVVAGIVGHRTVPAEAFFTGLMQTALAPGELIAEVRIPIPSATMSWAFHELARRHGDFALAGLAATMTPEGLRLVYFGCADHAALARTVASLALRHTTLRHNDAALIEALRADLGEFDTPGLRSETRLGLGAVVTCRALEDLRVGRE